VSSRHAASSCLLAPPPAISPLPLVIRPDWLLQRRLHLSLRHWAGKDTNSLNSFVPLGCSSTTLLQAAPFSLATFAIPCSIVGWLLLCAPLLLYFASACSLLNPHYPLLSPLHHWLVVAYRTAAPPLCYHRSLLSPCYLCRSPLRC
jgi:hypothetical protein